ncbi:MAG: hypothetical protein GY810_27610 [Aureispira sp.]|nr:hypothetical protein [Aureispira sp.]
MRVIGYLESSTCKITVFKQGFRFSVKFEDGLYEQTFKFRESNELAGINDIQKLIDEEFKQEVMKRFGEMRKATSALLDRYLEGDEEDWVNIV